MGTKLLDRTGKPFATVELRRRIGFLGGDLIAEHDTAGAVTPPERTYMVESNDSDKRPLPDKVFS